MCNICLRKFMSTAALKRHNESKHTEQQEVFGCVLCLKSFKTKWSLSTHTSRFHRPGSSAPVNRRSVGGVSAGGSARGSDGSISLTSPSLIMTKKFLK